MNACKSLVCIVAIAAITCPAALSSADEAYFIALGDLPGRNDSRANAVSADGSVVVGFSVSASGWEAWRWENGVMTGLGDLPGGGYWSCARGVSADGSVVVGESQSEYGREAFRWENGVMTGLGDLPGGDYWSSARSVSADGSVVVGYGHGVAFETLSEAVRWENGGIVGLGDLPGGYLYSWADAVSADGSVVGGLSSSASGLEACRWENGVMTGLGDLPGGTFSSHVVAFSADGLVAVGASRSAFGFETFRWENGVMTGLGDIPGGSFHNRPTDVSADGLIIVGEGQYEWGWGWRFDAYIWDAANGMQSLRDVLVDGCGLDLTGWRLTEASGTSDDGQTIVGWGFNPDGNREAWIAYIPAPIRLPLDIKPGSCPNSLNTNSHGVLPVALIGTEDFDVTEIDVSSVLLARADGVGGSVAPNEGPPGPHSVFADVATPFEGEPCACHELENDGIEDLFMKFRTDDVVTALGLAELEGDVELVVTGALLDGTEFTGVADCIHLVPTPSPAVPVRSPKAPGADQLERR